MRDKVFKIELQNLFFIYKGDDGKMKKRLNDNIDISLNTPNPLFYKIPDITFIYKDKIIKQLKEEQND